MGVGKNQDLLGAQNKNGLRRIVLYRPLLNYPILSLHMAGMIAKTSELIVDPNDLKVIAFKLVGPEIGKNAGEYLRTENVREFSALGMVVDSSDDFVMSEDVIKLQEVLDLNFSQT